MSKDDVMAALKADNSAYIKLDLTKTGCGLDAKGTYIDFTFMFVMLFNQDKTLADAVRTALEFLDTEANKTEGKDDDGCRTN